MLDNLLFGMVNKYPYKEEKMSITMYPSLHHQKPQEKPA